MSETCAACKRELDEVIEEEEFEFDETEDEVGIAFESSTPIVGETETTILCSDCVRKKVISEEEAKKAAEKKEDFEIDAAGGFWESEQAKEILERQMGKALKDAIDLGDEEELLENEDLIEEILKDSHSPLGIVVTADEEEEEEHTW